MNTIFFLKNSSFFSQFTNLFSKKFKIIQAKVKNRKRFLIIKKTVKLLLIRAFKWQKLKFPTAVFWRSKITKICLNK